jgi:hypothetical protein
VVFELVLVLVLVLARKLEPDEPATLLAFGCTEDASTPLELFGPESRASCMSLSRFSAADSDFAGAVAAAWAARVGGSDG